MNKKEFIDEFRALLESNVTSGKRVLDSDEKIREIRNQLIRYEVGVEYPQDNKGKSWTDEELKLVLSLPPTKENCLKLAKAFKRGYGSIEQIYRWAVTPEKSIKGTDRENDSFIKQIQKAYKESGWRA